MTKSDESVNTTGADKPARGNRHMMRTIGAIALVLAVMTLLFALRQESKRLKLQDQYMSVAVRAAHHIALNLDKYEAVATSISAPIKASLAAHKRELRAISAESDTQLAHFDAIIQTTRETNKLATARIVQLKKVREQRSKTRATEEEARKHAADALSDASDEYSQARQNVVAGAPPEGDNPQVLDGPHDAERLGKLHVEETKQFNQLISNLVAVETATQSHERAANEVQKAESAIKTQEGIEQRSETARKAYEAAKVLTARDAQLKMEALRSEFTARITNSVLPSYVTPLENECGEPPEFLCSLRVIAKLTDASGLKIDECRHEGKKRSSEPTVVRDRVVIPLPEGLACASMALGDIFTDDLYDAPKPGAQATVGQVDQALLVDAGGRVLAAGVTTGPVQLKRLERAPNQAGGKDRTTPAQGDASGTKSSAAIDTTEIGGKQYLVFVQPIQGAVLAKAEAAIAETETGEAKRDGDAKPAEPQKTIFVAMLVEKDRILRESRQFNLQALVWCALLVGLALLTIPVAKLWLLGQNSEFDRFDVGLLGFATVLSALLAAVAGWAAHSQRSLTADLDERLELIAEKAKEVLTKELDQAIQDLGSFDKGTSESRKDVDTTRKAFSATPPPKRGSDELCADGMPDWSSNFRCVTWMGYASGKPEPVWERTGGSRVPTKDTASDPFSQFLWSAPTGEQLMKSTSRPHATLPIDQGGRTYFQRAAADNVQCLCAPPATDPRPRDGEGEPSTCLGTRADSDTACVAVHAEIVRSRITGNYMLVAARPDKAFTQHAPYPVLSVTREITNLDDVVLPEDFAVAVIDAQGNTLFRSGPHKSSRHGYNVLEDVSSPERLRAAMRTHSRQQLDIEYVGMPMRLVVDYMPETGWYLVSAAPRTPIDKMVATMVTATIGGFVALAIMVLLGLVVISAAALLWSGQRRHRGAPNQLALIRPQLRHTRQYWIASVACLTSSVTIGGMALWLPRTGAVMLAFAWIVGLVVHWYLFGASSQRVAKWLSRRAPAARRSPRLETCYVLWLLSVVVLCVGVPATIIFHDAYDHVVANSVRAEQSHLIHSVLERSRRIREVSAQRSVVRQEASRASASSGTPKDVVSASANSWKSLSTLGTKDEQPWLLLGREKNTVSAAHSQEAPLHAATFTGMFDLMTEWFGPLATPHGALVLSSWQRRPVQEVSDVWQQVDGQWYKVTFPIPALLQRAWPAAGLVFAYLATFVLVFGWGVLVARRLFFMRLLTRQELLLAPTFDNLPVPLAADEKVVVITDDAALRAQLRRDFRYQSVSDTAQLPKKSKTQESRHERRRPWLVELERCCTDAKKWQQDLLEFLKSGHAALLVLSSTEVEVAKAALGSRWEQLEVLEHPDGSQALLSPPRYLIHNPSSAERDSYTQSKRFAAAGAAELSDECALFVEDFDACMAEIDATKPSASSPSSETQLLLAAMDQRIPVVACSRDTRRYDHSACPGMLPPEQEKLVAEFLIIRGPVRHDSRLARHHVPTHGQVKQIWQDTTPDERIVLCQLAHHGFITPHPHWMRTVEALTTRAVLDPASLTMHPQLAEYVRTQVTPEAFAAQAPRDSNAWDSLKVPLTTAVIAACAVFGVSEPQLALGSALAPSALAALPVLLRLLRELPGFGGAAN